MRGTVVGRGRFPSMNTPFSQLVTALRNVPVRQFIAALGKDGFAQLTGSIGAHQYYKHPDGRRAEIAYHKRSDTLPRTTLEGFLRATQWNHEDAIAFGLLRR